MTIPAGRAVLLDEDASDLGGLIIRGSLTFAETPLRLSSRWILVDGGTLNIGSSDALHTNQAVITLTGTDENENITGGGHHSVGTKCIGVVNGGRLELHGARAAARSWTQLNGHALAGSTQLQVEAPVDWKPGDRLAVAPSGFDPTEAEEVVVTQVTDGVIHFAPPLRHDHWGELQIIGEHTIDERAEVACLTRNIVIQGDEASALSEFGGHLMFHHKTTIHLEGVELFRMGQKGHAARYPIHWHLAEEPPGDYARGNSIHHSYHRAIVVHGTSNVLVENNLSYDVWSHAFLPSEDGTETGNRFIDNLAILTRRLAPGDYAFPDQSAGGSFQSEGRPGAFWLKNPEHHLVGNHAAGVVNGMGFFYDGPGLTPAWAGSFSNNTAHSCSTVSGSLADRYPTLTKGYGLFIGNHSLPGEIQFGGFTAYKNTLSGMWLEGPGQQAHHAMLADNGTGAILFQSTIEDSVIMGRTGNAIGALPPVGTSFTGGVHLVADEALKFPQLRNLEFIDQRDAAVVILGTRLHPRSTLANLRFTRTLPCRIDQPTQLIGGITDVDGSLTGTGIPVYVHGNDPLVTTTETEFNPTLNAWVTPLSSLQFISFTDTRPSADALGFTMLIGDTQVGVLADTTVSAQAPARSGYLKKDGVYTVLRFDPLPEGTRIAVEARAPGFVQLEIPGLSPAYVYGETTSGFHTLVPDFAHMAPQSTSLPDFRESTATRWYGDSATQTLHLRLADNQAVRVFAQPTGGIDVTAPEALWQSQKFGYDSLHAAEAETLWGALADPDGDELPNRLEFFLGTNPLRPDSPLVFHPELRRLSFPRNPAASDLAFQVLYSTDCAAWHATTQVEESPLPDGSVQVSATAPDLPSNDSLFMVLRCTHR